jgi:Xaa-Pro aminopeptidase
MPITKEDYLRRIGFAKKKMENDGVDLMIIYGDSWRDGNFRYFTGISPFAAMHTDYSTSYGPYALLAIPMTGEPIYFVADAFLDSVKMEIEPIENEPWLKIKPWSKLLKDLEEVKVKDRLNRIALVGQEIIPNPIYSSLKNVLGEINITNIPDLLRIIKDEKEIKLLERAGEITDMVYEDIVEAMLKPGKTEAEIAREIIASAIMYGAEQVDSDILVMSGPYEITRLGRARDVPIRRGTLLEFHLTPRYQGYCCDSDRGIGFGRIAKEQEELLEVAEDAHEAAMKTMRPGIKGSEVLKAANAVNENLVGTAPALVYGHGIGLQFEEIGFIDNWILEPGMTFTLAVGTYKKDVGAVRVEDVCTVTKMGGRSLTNFERALVVV